MEESRSYFLPFYQYFAYIIRGVGFGGKINQKLTICIKNEAPR